MLRSAKADAAVFGHDDHLGDAAGRQSRHHPQDDIGAVVDWQVAGMREITRRMSRAEIGLAMMTLIMKSPCLA